MKKYIALFVVILLYNCKSSERVNDNILQTKDIAKIENFLNTAHPEDPRISILKQKRIALKNENWVSGKANAKPMQARPIYVEIPKVIGQKDFKNAKTEEYDQFQKILAENNNVKKEKTIALLNQMFSTDISDNKAIFLVQNQSDCNMILNVNNANKNVVLAIPSKGENFLILEKGKYKLSSNLCNANYNSSIELQKSMMISLKIN